MLKKRFVIDFEVFNLMLRELRAIRKELRNLKTVNNPAKKSEPAREIKDKIYTPDVLKKLKITAVTLGNYEKKGLISSAKEGRNKIYSEAEILAFKKFKGKGKRVSKRILAKAANPAK